MESSLDLVNELSQGMELAKQLQIHLNATSSSHEARELLAHKILNSYDKALAMLKWNEPIATLKPQPNTEMKIEHSDSPWSFSETPNSEDFNHVFKDIDVNTESSKRKSMPRWTQQVQVCPEIGLGGQLDDGYSWRKYGQKYILGAKYPRGYYRCALRKAQGCLATKQVQRSDEDATIFVITYRGIHTCKNDSKQKISPSTPPEKKEPNATFHSQHQIIQHNQNENEIQSREAEEMLSQNTNFFNENNSLLLLMSHAKAENNFISPPNLENKFLENYFSPSFMSPATSESNYYSLFDNTCNVNGLDSELMGTTSVHTSANNSPTVGLDYPFGPMDQLEPIFSFDSPSFFSNSQNGL